MIEKLKSLLADETLFYTLLLILISVCSFGLGRLSVENVDQATVVQAPAGVFLTQQPLPEPKLSTSDEIVVVASRSGTKYHLSDCPGASQIKTENLIEFASIQDAEAAGYTPAANCDFN